METRMVIYKSATVSDTSLNGGMVSSDTVDDLQSGWWPDFTDNQLTSGATQWRKSFVRVYNDLYENGCNLKIGLKNSTYGISKMYLAKGTDTDTQATAASLDLYGSGKLKDSVYAGGTEISVILNDENTVIFRAGDSIRISSEVLTMLNGNPSVVAGDSEIKTIESVLIEGTVAIITLIDPLVYSYIAYADTEWSESAYRYYIDSPDASGNWQYITDTQVSSMISVDVVSSVTGKSVVSTAGTFNETLMQMPCLGVVYQTITITFITPSLFVVTSNNSDFSSTAVTAGSISLEYSPINVLTGQSYFTIPTTCWGGTFAKDDTVSITTIPPHVPVWEKRVLLGGTVVTSTKTQKRTLTVFVDR